MNQVLLRLLNSSTLLLFVGVLSLFGMWSPRFLTGPNLINILVQSSATAVVAMGMTFVLLTASVDLSVGAVMFVAAAVAGKILSSASLVASGWGLPLALLAILGVGTAGGAVNAFLITRLRILPFVATLGTLYIGRGLGLWITQTRAMNLPESFLILGTARMAGLPLPLLLLGVVVAAAHLVLTRTPFGRQIYAVGTNPEAARKAGVNTRRIQAAVHLIAGIAAALGAILSLTQLGAVSPTFGLNREFSAIAAAVLGGASLFGGRGAVFPGTLLGAVLIQSVENGLVIVNADPYLYPIITSAIIFLAVLIDSTRHRLLAHLHRRRIFTEPLEP
jgi:ribose transport system permease protein